MRNKATQWPGTDMLMKARDQLVTATGSLWELGPDLQASLGHQPVADFATVVIGQLGELSNQRRERLSPRLSAKRDAGGDPRS